MECCEHSREYKALKGVSLSYLNVGNWYCTIGVGEHNYDYRHRGFFFVQCEWSQLVDVSVLLLDKPVYTWSHSGKVVFLLFWGLTTLNFGFLFLTMYLVFFNWQIQRPLVSCIPTLVFDFYALLSGCECCNLANFSDRHQLEQICSFFLLPS